MADLLNPIRSVDGVALPSPSVYEWQLADISAPSAGRTENGDMKKERIGQAVQIHIEYHNVSIAVTSTILRAYNPEYIDVCYLDAMMGTWQTNTFYVGDRSAPLYNSALGLWSNISFTIIMRNGGQILT